MRNDWEKDWDALFGPLSYKFVNGVKVYSQLHEKRKEFIRNLLKNR